MANFKNALNAVLTDMLSTPENEDSFCCAVYWDDYCEDNAIVMFMEYNAYESLHAVMKDLHTRLSERMGHPVSICHNNPTDENILIHGAPEDAHVYYSDECCKKTVLECYERWNESGRGEGYRPEIRSLFFGAECIAEGLNKTPEYVLNNINWDEDPQAQMIRMLLDYHC